MLKCSVNVGAERRTTPGARWPPFIGCPLRAKGQAALATRTGPVGSV